MPRTRPRVNHIPAFGTSGRWAAVLLVGGYLLVTFALRGTGTPDVFPPVAIATIDGRSFDAAALRGRPVLVTFWSTTCVVCLREMPDLEALYRRLSPRGFEIIAVSMPWDPPTRWCASPVPAPSPTRWRST